MARITVRERVEVAVRCEALVAVVILERVLAVVVRLALATSVGPGSYARVDDHVTRPGHLIVTQVVLKSAEDKEVVCVIVVRRAVIVIQSPHARVAVDDEVLVNPIRRRNDIRIAGGALPGGDIGLSVPAVKGAVISGLADHVEHEVSRQQVGAAEAVVEVDAGARSVVADVVLHGVAARERLEVAGYLLSEHAEVVYVISDNRITCRIRWLHAVDHAGAANSGDRTVAGEGDFVLRDRHVAYVLGEEDGIASGGVEYTV